MKLIKLFLQYIIYYLLHFFHLFPVKENQVYFVAFNGLRYACNPKYLYEYLVKNKYNNYTFIWEFRDLSKKSYVPDAIVVKHNSIKALYYRITSKYIITNNESEKYIPLRKKQTLVETWHAGGAYKKVGVEVGLRKKLIEKGFSKIVYAQMNHYTNYISYYLSSCKRFTEIQSKAKHVPIEKFISTGLPRNSIFFQSHPELKDKVFSQLPEKFIDYKLLLYAPTYRGDAKIKKNKQTINYEELDYKLLTQTLTKKFGGNWIILYRAHNYDSLISSEQNELVVNVTDYEDMQELLYISDILITDYSSSIWDFSLTNKPGFLYAPDLNEYENERNFFTPINEWQYPLAKTNEELCKNIMSYTSEENILRIKKHFSILESYENENSCKQVISKIGLSKNGD